VTGRLGPETETKAPEPFRRAFLKIGVGVVGVLVVNVFAAGGDTEPIGSNTQAGGTHPAAVTAHAAAEGILMYLASPGPLV